MTKHSKKLSDEELGMQYKISSRDLLHGLGALSLSSLSVGSLNACSTSLFSGHAANNNKPITGKIKSLEPVYPPASTGLRGIHQGSFEVAHKLSSENNHDWAHGYAYWYKPMFDTVYEDNNDKRYPHIIARKPFGEITIANADLGSKAMFESAVEQGYRAINE